ncbi:MAG TPA: xylulokinase [Oculatellaceae cyanobacterium]
MSVFLGIDIGTSGTKTIAINASGTVLSQAVANYASFQPKPLWSEQNPEDWWQATVATVRQVMQKANLKPADVKAIGLSGQMHGAVFLDQQNNIIRPAILWNDQRTAKECAEIEATVGGRANLVSMVANPALTGFTAPKILWLRNHEPKNFEKTRKILLPKDEIRRRLTGEFATDVSDASGTLLLDVSRRQWSKELLGALDLDLALMPKCYESPEVTGQLLPSVAEMLGLTKACLVVGGAGDCPANAIGNGVVKTGTLSTSIGTSSVLLMHSEEFAKDPNGRLHTICHSIPGKWLMMGVNLSGGGSLQWFRNELCKTDHAGTTANFYELLSREAAGISAGSEGLFWLPFLSGERTPHNDPDARACFIGLTLSHTRAHMIRSIMEGVAYNMRHTLEIMTDLGVPVNEIRVSGGGSQSDLWRSIQASCFGRNVATINCDEGPAFGVALLAAAGSGAFASVEEACQSIIKVVSETHYDNAAKLRYDKAFPIFKNLYKSLKSNFKAIAGIEADCTHENNLLQKIAD